MFGERIDGHLTMLQRLVALFRDLILGITVLLTCVIVYFGGDASKLSVLDWAKLVSAAISIVAVPLITFTIFWLLLKGFYVLTYPYFYLHYPAKRLPSTLYFWYYTKHYRTLSKRQYVTMWHNRQRSTQTRMQNSRIRNLFHTFVVGYTAVMLYFFRWYVYVLAIGALVIGVTIFQRTVRFYIP